MSLGTEYDSLDVLQNFHIPVMYFAITDVREGCEILKELIKYEYVHQHRFCIWLGVKIEDQDQTNRTDITHVISDTRNNLWSVELTSSKQ